jgi:hypothetical protein
MKINMGIVNDVTTSMQNFIMKFLELWAIKNNKIYRFENIHTRIYMFAILCSPKCELFELDFLHVCEINSWIYLIFHFFWNSQIYFRF